VKNWEIIANNLSKAGWSWGCVSAIDSQGRTVILAAAVATISPGINHSVPFLP
jgi:hypothetical protein